MRSLEVRLRRLEERFRKKKTGAPSQHDFLESNARQRTRNLYNAKLRLVGEEWAWDRLSESDRAILESDTSELQERDADVLRRSEGVHWQDDSGAAERCIQRLRGMTRLGTGDNPSRWAGVPD